MLHEPNYLEPPDSLEIVNPLDCCVEQIFDEDEEDTDVEDTA